MNTRADWYEANRRHLLDALSRVRTALERHAGDVVHASADAPPGATGDATYDADTPFALDIIVQRFNLSPFERDVLLLAAGPELDGAFETLLAGAQRSGRPVATFGLALAALSDAHWSALTPAAPLRRWRIIELEPATTLMDSPLRIDERILHFLAGAPHADERLRGIVRVLDGGAPSAPSARAALHAALPGRWLDDAAAGSLPILSLHGADAELRRAAALDVGRALGAQVMAIATESLPAAPLECTDLLRYVQRECALEGALLLVELDDSTADRSFTTALRELSVPAIIAAERPVIVEGRAVVPAEVAPLSGEERRAAWHGVLGAHAASLNGAVDRIADQFRLGLQDIAAVGSAVAAAAHTDAADLETRLWSLCRVCSRPRLDGLAERIHAAAEWRDLVLPDAQLDTLRTISLHVRHRVKVQDTWGLADRSGRGQGITALFTGPSGTGKTMAAEVLARELSLDLYRIDLSQVVSKYIGETEKNLRRVFAAAEGSSAILLFDEADALFGRRSEVKDSHDRYANIEVSYLLQRMESYRGLAVLTTNLASAIDAAFLRRLRFSVAFPFPDAAARCEIWRRVFPATTPTDGVDPQRLARLSVAGGNIRNIALHAAFFAAAEDAPVRMPHLLRAARLEYAKLERPLTGQEIGGW
ncbi:ATP-binding protein [soil metagenome]